MTTTIGTVDQFVLTSTTNGTVIGPLSNAVIVSAVVHNISASNRALTMYRVFQGGVPATNSSLGVTTIPTGGAPTVLTFMSGQGLDNSAFYAVADATNSVVFNATWAVSS